MVQEHQNPPHPVTAGLFQAIRRQACPRCREGQIFDGPLRYATLWRGFLKMHDRCPVCGLKFEREPGYFLGALYFSYALSLPPGLLLIMLIWRWTLWPFDLVMLGAFVAYLPLVPIVTRWARVLWIHLDQHFDPE
jgi:uncharacterized protein (DUF983 family)